VIIIVVVVVVVSNTCGSTIANTRFVAARLPLCSIMCNTIIRRSFHKPFALFSIFVFQIYILSCIKI
jgi:hypothetical protein